MLLDGRPILEWLGSSPPADKAPVAGDSVVLLAVSPEALQRFHPPYLLTCERKASMDPRLPGPGSFSHRIKH